MKLNFGRSRLMRHEFVKQALYLPLLVRGVAG